jgi:UDP-N-acetylmuramoyl-L-alanyl-D-glutamate--2,6-diaminopimelate ligase
MMALAAHPAGWNLSLLLSGLSLEQLGPSQAIEHLCVDANEAGAGSLLLVRSGQVAEVMAEAETAALQGCRAIALDRRVDLSAEDLAHITKTLAMTLTRISAIDVQSNARSSLGIDACIGAIAARFYADPSSALPVIGIQGGAEASSVAHFIAQALADERCGLIASLGVGFPDEHLGDGLGDQGLRQASPLELQHALAHLKGAGAGAAVLEIPDAPQRDALDLDAWLQTNAIKLKLALAHHERRPHRHRQADDPYPRCAHAEGWLQINRVRPGPEGLRLRIDSSAGLRELELPLLGRANVENLSTLLSALLALGRDPAASLNSLARIRPVPGRMEGFGGQHAPLVVVDATKTPADLADALQDLREHRQGRLITVFGCQGHRDEQQRPEWGRVAEQLSDLVILTDQNPAGENGDHIIAEILDGARDPGKILIERQRGLAIRRAMTVAGRGDTLLVAGKGQEKTQDMGELKVRFSDRAQVVQALSEWRGNDR